jgi:hypothetical protein
MRTACDVMGLPSELPYVAGPRRYVDHSERGGWSGRPVESRLCGGLRSGLQFHDSAVGLIDQLRERE